MRAEIKEVELMIFEMDEILKEIQRQTKIFGGLRTGNSCFGGLYSYFGMLDSTVSFTRNTILLFSNKKENCEDNSDITLEQFVSDFIGELIESKFSYIRDKDCEVIKRLVHKSEKYNSLVCEEVFGGEFSICYLLKYDDKPAFFVDTIILKALHMTEEEFLEAAKKEEKRRSDARFLSTSYGLEIRTKGEDIMGEVLKKRFLDRIGEKLDLNPFILATGSYGRAVAIKYEDIKTGLNPYITSEDRKVKEAIQNTAHLTFSIRYVFYFDPRKNYFANIGDKPVTIKDLSFISDYVFAHYDDGGNLNFPISSDISLV